MARFPARSRQDFCHCEFAPRRESWRDSQFHSGEILAAGIFASRRESWRDVRRDPGEILAARIFASRRDSRQDPGEILAAGNFVPPRESCRDPGEIPAGMKNPSGQNLAGIPTGFPSRSRRDPAKIPVLILQGLSLGLQSSGGAAEIPKNSADASSVHGVQVSTDTELAGNDFLEQPITAHENRRIQQEIKWAEIRDDLVHVAIEESSLPTGAVCIWCQETSATIRCHYCGPQTFLCSECARKLHSSINTYHVLELWKVQQ